jgi:glutamine amidotransferase
MKIAIVKYNAGNSASVQFSLKRMNVDSVITGDPEIIRGADKVIFPGVGEASSAMRHLKETGIDRLITTLKQPVLGICLGMQLMCNHSEEGNTDTLNLFPVNVRRFISETEKVPHMGWNTIGNMKGDLFRGIPENQYVYYVHSFYAGLNPNTSAETDYILPFSAALQKDNFFGVQFHPEKSGATGELILKNFIAL